MGFGFRVDLGVEGKWQALHSLVSPGLLVMIWYDTSSVQFRCITFNLVAQRYMPNRIFSINVVLSCAKLF